MSVTETVEYAEGAAWADRNLDTLRERFHGRDLQTQELRDVLWPTAERLFKPMRESMENDVKATSWVAGAVKRLTETMETSPEGMAAIFEVALEMGSIFGAEKAKHEALESLKEKPGEWWKKKMGDASPNTLLKPIYSRWWREVGSRENRSRTTKWEALKHTLGAREMRALATLKNVAKQGSAGDQYILYDIDGEDSGFQMMAEDAVAQGRVYQHAGDIVG